MMGSSLMSMGKLDASLSFSKIQFGMAPKLWEHFELDPPRGMHTFNIPYNRSLTLACQETWQIKTGKFTSRQVGRYQLSGRPLRQCNTESTPQPATYGVMGVSSMRYGVLGLNHSAPR